MRLRALVGTLILAAATTAQAQESILLRLGGRQGDVNRYRTVMETYVRGGPMASMMGGDTTQPMTRVTTQSTRTLTAIIGDTLVFTEVIDSAGMESPAMPQMAQMAGSMIAQMRGQQTVQKMDRRARTFSTEVTGGMSSMMGQPGGGGPGRGGRGGRGGPGGPGGGMGGQNDQRAVFLLPERAVRVGESWTDSLVTTEGGNTTSMLWTYRLVRVDSRGGARVAVLDVNGTMAQQTPQGPMNMSLTGQLMVDVTNGRLASFTMTMTGTVNSQMGEMPMKIQLMQSLM